MQLNHKRNILKRKFKKFAMLFFASKVSACGGGLSSNYTNEAQSLLNEISGTNAADTLRGSQENDIVWALDGDDSIFTYSGTDTIYAGTGSNVVYAGPGDDSIYVSSLYDIVDGGTGNDTAIFVGLLSGLPLEIDLAERQYTQLGILSSQSGELIAIENVDISGTQPVSVIGSTENNIIRTGGGDDIIKTGLGENSVESSGGDDNVYVSGLAAEISLGTGNDQLIIDTLPIGNLDGGDGTDSLVIFEIDNATDQMSIDLSNRRIIADSEHLAVNLVNFENVNYSGNLKVNLIGDGFSNSLIGGDASDIISGMGGVDTLRGGKGSDTFVFRSEDYLGKFGHPDIIEGFEFGASADTMQFTGEWNLSTTASNVQFFNLNQVGVKTLHDTSAVLVLTGAKILNLSGSPLKTLNSEYGIQLGGNARLMDHDFLCLTTQEGDDYARVSVLHYDRETTSFVSNNLVAQLNEIDNTQFDQIVSENFNIA